jgi:hypothetical protein
MTLDAYVHAALRKLRQCTQPVRAGIESGGPIEETELDGYTCGGAHFVESIGYALARGFGTDEDRAEFRDEIRLMFVRFRDRRERLRAAIQQHPEQQFLFLEQLFKYTGHFVETIHKFAALELFAPTEEDNLAIVEAAGELIATVIVLQQMHAFEQLDEIRARSEQTYLDLVGDSAHALRGLELATARAFIAH